MHGMALLKALNADKIEVFYLPSYSPELNPDELLNADLKQRITAAVPTKTQVQLFPGLPLQINDPHPRLLSARSALALIDRAIFPAFSWRESIVGCNKISADG